MGLTRVADSSFLIALFDAQDPRQATARTWISDPEPIQLLPEVLGETLGVVHRRAGFGPAKSLLEALRKVPHLHLAPASPIEVTAEAFVAANGRLSWVDAAVVAACKAHGSAPLCFDDAIARAA